MSAQSRLWPMPTWTPVKRCDVFARELADRHYSRKTPGAREFMANGRTLVLEIATLERATAVWGVIENRAPNSPDARWRVSIFRNESGLLSSTLIVEAVALTRAHWQRRYGGVPSVPLTTEVDPAATRRKRDPGRCFLRAGWSYLNGTITNSTIRGLVHLRAPEPP